MADDRVPARIYQPDRAALFGHVQSSAGHHEVTKERFDQEVRAMQAMWESPTSPRDKLGGVHAQYERDLREFFVDCHMWNKYSKLYLSEAVLNTRGSKTSWTLFVVSCFT